MVASGVEFHTTVEPATKPIPVTVRVKAALPAAHVAGLIAVIVGPLRVNVADGEEAVAEFWTVTLCDPTEASWVLVTAAVSEVALA